MEKTFNFVVDFINYENAAVYSPFGIETKKRLGMKV